LRHWLWFVVAGVMALGSLVAGYACIVWLLREADGGLKSFVVPGSISVVLDKRGTYTIFVELPRPEKDQRIIAAFNRGLSLQVTEEKSEKAIPLVMATSVSSFQILGRFGTSLLSFAVDNPGNYRITGAIVDSRIEWARLAIGQEPILSMRRIALFGVTVTLVGFAISLIIVAITIWQRSEAAAKVRAGGGQPV